MEEDLQHALIHCSHAQRFWVEARVWFDIHLHRLHLNSWSRDILCDPRFSDKDRPLIITIMWSIFHSKNRIKHNEDGTDPMTSMRMTKESLAILELPQNLPLSPSWTWMAPT